MSETRNIAHALYQADLPPGVSCDGWNYFETGPDGVKRVLTEERAAEIGRQRRERHRLRKP